MATKFMPILYGYILHTWTVVGRALVTTLIGIGLSAFLAGSAFSQIGAPPEKEWQFHNLSGTPIWVVKNQAVGNPPSHRNIYILLEPKYFKKDILTKLFTELSRKNTDVNWVVINAYSDVCRSKTPLRAGAPAQHSLYAGESRESVGRG
jgi:hypothetical protein